MTDVVAGTDADGNVSSGGGVVDFTNIHTAYDGQKGWVYLNEAFRAANVLIVPGRTYRVTVTDACAGSRVRQEIAPTDNRVAAHESSPLLPGRV